MTSIAESKQQPYFEYLYEQCSYIIGNPVPSNAISVENYPDISMTTNEIFQSIPIPDGKIGPYNFCSERMTPKDYIQNINQNLNAIERVSQLTKGHERWAFLKIIAHIAAIAGIIFGAYALLSGGVANGKLITGLMVGGTFGYLFLSAIQTEIINHRLEQNRPISYPKLLTTAFVKALFLPFFEFNSAKRRLSIMKAQISSNCEKLINEKEWIRIFLGIYKEALEKSLTDNADSTPERKLARVEFDRLVKAFHPFGTDRESPREDESECSEDSDRAEVTLDEVEE